MSLLMTYDVMRTGPVAAAYLRSSAPVAAIMGPMGSGKTAASIMKCIQAALRQEPSTRDGKRKVKIAIIRETYPQLTTNVLPSWWTFFPKEMGKWSGDSPLEHVIDINYMGYKLQIHALFIAIGDRRIEDVVKGLEINAAWINEADLTPRELFTGLRGRVAAGRYPSAMEGGPAKWAGVWVDFNAPDDENWTYETFVDGLPAGWEFYRQPSGLSPQAENLVNLKAGYYQEMASTEPAWWVRRFVKNQFGYSRDGMPVYGDDWNDELHVATEDFGPNKLQPILLGIDQGLNPAIVFGQQAPSGQWRIFDELVGENVSAPAFGEQFNRLIGQRYHGAEFIAEADPAAWQRTAAVTSGNDPWAWISSFCAVAKIKARAAPSNSPALRLGCVGNALRRLTAGQPGLLVSPRCRVLRKGFNSGYRLKRSGRVGGKDTYGETPEKNKFSNPHDALQYMILGNGGYADMMTRDDARSRARAKQPSHGRDYNPYGRRHG